MTDGWKLIKDVKFRPGLAVGLVYLGNPRNQSERRRVIEWFESNGVDVDQSESPDYLLVKPGPSLVAAIGRYAKEYKFKSLHDAMIDLLRKGLNVVYPPPKPQEHGKKSSIAHIIAKLRKAA